MLLKKKLNMANQYSNKIKIKKTKKKDILD